MRFSIITPTYNRADKLIRAVRSVQNQTYQDWELIIVNDSPKNEDYREFASTINDPRIHYHVNEHNMGVNFSRNKALDNISSESNWVIFLDDDDFLAPDTLRIFYNLIHKHPSVTWFITNRAHKNGESVTTVKKSDTLYSYMWDYLFKHSIKGDPTHAINTEAIHNIRFSKHVKQGEEWFFYYQLGLKNKLFYHNHNSTISDGYDEQGLNFRKRSRSERLKSIATLFYEGLHLGFVHNPTFLIYISIRIVRLIKN